MKGKLIVIEGADASGKHTQSKLLLQRLRKESFNAELVSFPRYNAFFGKLVLRYLRGGFGGMRSLPPQLPALLYALDRIDAAPKIENALRAGKVVVADRYSASNIAHQAAKLNGRKRKDFIEWIERVESVLPQPSVSFYLDVPVRVSRRLMEKRGRKKDLHERDAVYLEKVRGIYLRLARQPGWKRISCVRRGKLLPAEKIHAQIWALLHHYL
ncbi:MAG: dTMP kinase [Candidatus Diapherotrites archaeon]|nr:dTMP kinase [Candidatus Diapherotrites archaeon]